MTDRKSVSILRLYIAGMTPNNQDVILKFKAKLRERLDNNYALEIIDVFERPELAEGEKIIATPTIVNLIPNPAKQLILDFSSEEKLLLGMDLILSEEA